MSESDMDTVFETLDVKDLPSGCACANCWKPVNRFETITDQDEGTFGDESYIAGWIHQPVTPCCNVSQLVWICEDGGCVFTLKQSYEQADPNNYDRARARASGGWRDRL